MEHEEEGSKRRSYFWTLSYPCRKRKISDRIPAPQSGCCVESYDGSDHQFSHSGSGIDPYPNEASNREDLPESGQVPLSGL